MKYSLIVLFITVGILAVDKSAHANQENGTPLIGDRNSASVLNTEPLTINNQWVNSNNQNNLQQTDKPILTLKNNQCKINPVEIVGNPLLFFQECPQSNEVDSPYTRPIEYLRVPKLNGGIKLPVSKF